MSRNRSVLYDRAAWRGLGWMVVGSFTFSMLFFAWPIGLLLLGVLVWRFTVYARHATRRGQQRRAAQPHRKQR